MDDPETLLRSITYRPERRMETFRGLTLAERSAVFNQLSPRLRLDILEELSITEAIDLLDHLDPRRAQQVLSTLPDPSKRKKIISRLKNHLYEKVEHFLLFHANAKLSLIHLNYVYLSDETTIGEAAEIIEDHLENTGKVPLVLVNHNGEFSGEVPLSTMVRERNTSRLKKFVKPVHSIPYNAEHKDVVGLFVSSAHTKVVVLDTDGSVLGIVYSDDVLDLFGGQPASTLYSFAGVTQSERPFDGVMVKVKNRYKWLVINLATAFLAAGVVSAFNETISALVLLAVYMPIIAGMGGNAAAQTLAVTVRGITLGEIKLNNCLPAIVKEVKAAAINGAIVGLLVFIIAVIFGHGLELGLLAGSAVLLSLMVAALAGTLVPLILKHFGKDPASSATVFITTVTDVFGFFCLLGLATWFLL